MDGIPFHELPSFRSLGLGIVLAGIDVYNMFWGPRLWGNVVGIALDLLLLLIVLRICVYFYAQFVVPARSLEERSSISARVWLHARKAHGPAIFVKNGRRVERAGESDQRGPGLLWVDGASAAVTRSGANLSRILGPGIHFTAASEKLAGTFSLHVQTFTLGPAKDDPIFDKLSDEASAEERRKFVELQSGRMRVSGRTRDGNEVIPNITVLFKLDASPAAPGTSGSRFGFSKEAIEKAAFAEGVNPNISPGQREHVAWNQLPGMIAVDLWREYLGKFTLDELFAPNFASLPDVPQPDEPVPPIAMPETPLILRRNFLVRFLRRRNNALQKRLDQNGIGTHVQENVTEAERQEAPAPRPAQKFQTALQIIAQMMRERMTQAVVPILDGCGRVLEGHVVSEEYRRLKQRGLLILHVGIDNLRFDPAVEDQILQQWDTSWLVNAMSEREQVEQLERLSAEGGGQRALVEHALALSRAVQQENPRNISSAAKVLVQTTEFEIVTDPRLYARAGHAVETLSSMLKWVESREDG